VQVGTPKDIYGRPASEFIANFIGRTNLLRGVLARDALVESVAEVKTALGNLLCFFPLPRASAANVAMVVRPEHIQMRKGNGVVSDVAGTNRLLGHVTREIYLGEIVEYLVAVNGGEMLVRTSVADTFAKGDAVTLSFPADRTVALLQA
jgi:ABC-type Fe3+/spermidine/putrescine transport system ATPase subunit